MKDLLYSLSVFFCLAVSQLSRLSLQKYFHFYCISHLRPRIFQVSLTDSLLHSKMGCFSSYLIRLLNILISQQQLEFGENGLLQNEFWFISVGFCRDFRPQGLSVGQYEEHTYFPYYSLLLLITLQWPLLKYVSYVRIRWAASKLCQFALPKETPKLSKKQFPRLLFKMTHKELTSYPELVEFTLKNGGVAIVKFYHSDSAPCKLIEPYVNDYAKQFKIAVASIQAEKNEQIAAKFNIVALPTFCLVKKSGGEIQRNAVVISAHVQKLKKLFQTASDIRNVRK